MKLTSHWSSISTASIMVNGLLTATLICTMLGVNWIATIVVLDPIPMNRSNHGWWIGTADALVCWISSDGRKVQWGKMTVAVTLDLVGKVTFRCRVPLTYVGEAEFREDCHDESLLSPVPFVPVVAAASASYSVILTAPPSVVKSVYFVVGSS